MAELALPKLAPEERALLQRAHGQMLPLAEPFFRNLFAAATGCGDPSAASQHYLDTEFSKLKCLCDWDFGSRLTDIQEALIDQLLAAGMTKASYLIGYGYYFQQVTGCLLSALGPEDPEREEALHLFQRAVMIEATLALGYFDRRLEADLQRQREELAGNFRDGVAQLVAGLSGQMQTIAQTARRLEEHSASADAFAVTSQSAAANTTGDVEKVASATHALSTAVEGVASQIARASKALGDAASRADDASERIDALNAFAQSVGSVVGVISRIAEQTNMLAINASIEAARAGDEGRGFAVVAAEIKKLAHDTHQETTKIADTIGQMSAAMADSVNTISEVSSTVSSANTLLAEGASVTQDQSQSTSDIVQSMASVAEQAQIMSSHGEELSGLVSETNRAAKSITATTSEAAKASENLQRSVDAFLERMTA